MSKRNRTTYVGVYWIEGTSPATGKPDRIYYIRYKRDGKTVEEKAGRSSIDAMTPAKASQIRANRMSGKSMSNQERRDEEARQKAEELSRPTLSRLWEEFRRHKSENKSISEDACRWKKYIEGDFSHKTPCEIVTLDIDRLRIKLTKSGLAPATVKQVLVLMKRVINYGIKKGISPSPDPSKLHFEMPLVQNEVTEDLSPEQLGRLLSVLDEYDDRRIADIMRLALFTGMRRGEIFSLQWEDVSLERGTITIRNPKGGSDQKIPLSPEARQIIVRQEQGASSYVFPSNRGKRLADISYHTEKIRERAGLPKTFRPMHGLRHVFASILASSGKVDLYTLQKLLTHKSPQMTQRYAHLADEALRRAANVAGDIFTSIEGKMADKVVPLRAGEEKD